VADEYVILGLDDVGADDLGADDVGADDLGADEQILGAARPRRRGQRRQLPAGALAVRKMPQQMPARAGLKPGLAMQLTSLGFPAAIWIAAAAALQATQVQNTRPFQGRKLVVTVLRVGATSNGLVTISVYRIGSDEQLPSNQPVDVNLFLGQNMGDNLVTRGALAYEIFFMQFLTTIVPGGADTLTALASHQGVMIA
jgi:hypothetical protein